MGFTNPMPFKCFVFFFLPFLQKAILLLIYCFELGFRGV